jgi:hypothetical protein
VARFKPFRENLGKFLSSGDKKDLANSLAHYVTKGTGGGEIAARRMGSVTKAGGGLFGFLNGKPTDGIEGNIDLAELSGLSCENAISKISQALSTRDGDSDKIRASMNHALTEALDGVEIFDMNCITDEVIVATMIGYLAESIFLQIVMDAGKSWNKAETPSQAIDAENSLREVVKVIVDKKLFPKLTGSIRRLTPTQVIILQREVIKETWADWERFQ